MICLAVRESQWKKVLGWSREDPSPFVREAVLEVLREKERKELREEAEWTVEKDDDPLPRYSHFFIQQVWKIARRLVYH